MTHHSPRVDRRIVRFVVNEKHGDPDLSATQLLAGQPVAKIFQRGLVFFSTKTYGAEVFGSIAMFMARWDVLRKSLAWVVRPGAETK